MSFLKNTCVSLFAFSALCFSEAVYAGQSDAGVLPDNGCGSGKVLLPYADFENWLVRVIKESSIVGGDSVEVFAVAESGLKRGNVPYVNTVSPWASSNVYAEVSGVTKVNVNVRPAKYEDGRGTYAELSTEEMSFKVLGTLRINVLTAGALYYGTITEPIKGMDDPYATIDMGRPFTGRPKALVLDYSAVINNSGIISRISAMKKKTYSGYDRAQVFVQLQKRWEQNGKVYAQRVATGELLIDKTVGWKRGEKIMLVYGEYPDVQELSEKCRLNSLFHTRNSRGEMVPVEEVGWADPGTEPTHIIIYLSSGSLDVFCGELGNKLCVDNIYLEY